VIELEEQADLLPAWSVAVARNVVEELLTTETRSPGEPKSAASSESAAIGLPVQLALV
jgi:hypothetical protein